MANIITMIESASVMLLAVLAMAAIRTRFDAHPVLRGALFGLLFSLVGVVVISNSVEIIPGIRTDPRSAVVTLAAAFGGPIAVGIAAPIMAFVRYLYGGSGATPGVIYILGVGIVALTVQIFWVRAARRPMGISYVVAQAAVAGLVPVLILLVVSQAPWSVFLLVNALALPTNVIAVLIMGTMVLRDIERGVAMEQRTDKQAQIDTIANNAPAILFQLVRNANGHPRLTYVSNASERILGVKAGELTARFSTLDALASPNDMARIAAKIDASAISNEPWTDELECIRPDGGVIWLRIDAGPRRDTTGRTVWDGTIIDATEQKNAERMKDDFISTVSHELRTPLTSIRGSLGLVVGNAADQMPPKIVRMLEIANRNAERLVLLINDILDLQKIRSGEMNFSRAEEALRPIVDQAMHTAQSYLPEKEMKLVLTDDAPETRAMVDADRLNQVLTNLLSNAIKFSPDRSTITVSIMHEGPVQRISVRDEGAGIPKQFHDRIFDRFSQAETSSTRKAGGTGLGLNISKAIVDAMDGDLWFESVEGIGTTFHIDLQMLEGQQVTATASNAILYDHRILICSTDPTVNQALISAVSCDQTPTDMAPDMHTALNLAADRDYSVLIMDTGAVASADELERACSDARSRGLPVIIVSDCTYDCTEGSAADTLDCLIKPLDIALFGMAIERAISLGCASQPRVLYVEDDPCLQLVMRQALGDDARITAVRSIESARALLLNGAFELVLLDLDLPDGSGADLLADIPAEVPVHIFSAFEVSPDIETRVVSVMTKSRVREGDVARRILETLTGNGPTNTRIAKVA